MRPNVEISPDFRRFHDTLLMKKSDRIPQFDFNAEQRRFDILFAEVGKSIGAVQYSDDIAYTEGLMLNPATYRKYLFQYVEKHLALPK